MTLFFPDLVLPGDPEGMGFWLLGHSYEHKAMLLNNRVSVLQVPDYDLTLWSPQEPLNRDWQLAHYTIHLALRQASGVSGYDLTTSNWQDPEVFLDWQQIHADEHVALRGAFGLA